MFPVNDIVQDIDQARCRAEREDGKEAAAGDMRIADMAGEKGAAQAGEILGPLLGTQERDDSVGGDGHGNRGTLLAEEGGLKSFPEAGREPMRVNGLRLRCRDVAVNYCPASFATRACRQRSTG